MPIQLHTDFLVNLDREEEFLNAFRNEWLPRVRKAPGFIEGKMLKLRKANVGEAPTQVNYRICQTFETEEQRIAWSESEEHHKCWPLLEKPLNRPPGTKWLFTAYLFDEQ